MEAGAIPGATHIEAAMTKWSPAARVPVVRRSHQLCFVTDACTAPSQEGVLAPTVLRPPPALPDRALSRQLQQHDA